LLWCRQLLNAGTFLRVCSQSLNSEGQYGFVTCQKYLLRVQFVSSQIPTTYHGHVVIAFDVQEMSFALQQLTTAPGVEEISMPSPTYRATAVCCMELHSLNLGVISVCVLDTSSGAEGMP
jgi:hypothetical protein